MSGGPLDIPGLGMPIGDQPYPSENFDPDVLVATGRTKIDGSAEGGDTRAAQPELVQKSQEEEEDLAKEQPGASTGAETKGSEALADDRRLGNETDDYVMTVIGGDEDAARDGEPMSLDTTKDGEPEASQGGNSASPPGLTDALEAALDELLPQKTISEEPAQGEPSVEEATGPTNEGEAEWEEDSDPYESSSESSSSDSSSDEDSDDAGAYPLLGAEETAKLLMASEEDGDGDEGEKRGWTAHGHVRTKNEVIEAPLPKPDVVITPEMRIELLGDITSIIGNTLVIKSGVPGEVQALDTGSVLCKNDKTVIAALSDTLGSVRNPAYAVVFAKEDEITELGLAVGVPIYYSVQHAHYVFTRDLKAVKGSDASNINDEEVAADEAEFSDDEKEAEYRRQLKQKRRGGKTGRWDSDFGPHPLRQEVNPSEALRYEEGEGDDEDGPYKPLTRPAGFAQGVPESLPAPVPPPGNQGFRGGYAPRGQPRGRGRGDARGGRHRGGYRGGRGDRQGGGGYGGSGGFNHDRSSNHNSSGGFSRSTAQGSPVLPSPSPPIPQWPGFAPTFAGFPGTMPQVSPPASSPPIPNFNFNTQGWNAGQAQRPAQPYGVAPPPPQLPNSYHQMPAAPPWPGTPQTPPLPGQNYNPGFYPPPQVLQQGDQQIYQQHGQPSPYWSQQGGNSYGGQ